MHANVQRVVEAAAIEGLDITPTEFPEGTRTAEDAANAIGCTVGQIVKSLVFTIDDEPVLALVSGSNRLDEDKLAVAFEGGEVGRADADLVKSSTGYSIGGVPPFGHTTPLRTVVDEDLLAFDEIWAAAGTPRDVFPLRPADLLRVTGGSPHPLRVD